MGALGQGSKMEDEGIEFGRSRIRRRFDKIVGGEKGRDQNDLTRNFFGV